MRRILGKEPNVNDYLPVGPAAYYLQYHYIVTNPYPADAAQAARRRRRRQRLQRAARHLPSAAARRRRRASASSISCWPIPGPAASSMASTRKSISRRLPAQRLLPPVQRRRRRRPLRRHADRSAVCLEDFAPYAPSGGAPIAFMAAPVIDQGVVIGVLIAQLSIEEIDNVVTGDRRWRQDGFGATGEAYLVGPDHLARSGPRAFYEAPRSVLRRAEAGRRVGRGDRRHPPLRHAGAAPAYRHRGRPGRSWPASRAPARSSAIAASRRSHPGGRWRFPASSGR